MKESEGQHISDYELADSTALLPDAANLIRALGFAGSHLVLIGGLAPSLLVPVLDPGLDPHIGTTDLDLCMSVALIEGETGQYERAETVLRRLGFEPDDATFRWVRRSTPVLTVEFFCPAGPGRPAGQLYRPLSEDNPTAKHNLGARLSALALRAGDLLVTDVEKKVIEVSLPEAKGLVSIELQVSGPLAFLAAKLDALVGRDKPKDAYDIVWLIESWPGGPAAAAAAFSARPSFNAPAVTDALERLAGAFATSRDIGPRSYARFATLNADDQPLLERRAVGAVALFLESLPTRYQ